jgi:hypothetical protein
VRALAGFGYAFRAAAAPSAMPFALAREPGHVGAHTLGFVLGSLVSEPELHARLLGLGRRAAAAQARILARTALLEARLDAARVLLGESGPDTRDAFEEVSARLFGGAPLDPRLGGVWPAWRDDEPARWLALLQAPALRRSLREEYDSDWFRNPRAWVHLRALGARPAYEAVAEGVVDAGAADLARAFEDALA